MSLFFSRDGYPPAFWDLRRSCLAIRGISHRFPSSRVQDSCRRQQGAHTMVPLRGGGDMLLLQCTCPLGPEKGRQRHRLSLLSLIQGAGTMKNGGQTPKSRVPFRHTIIQPSYYSSPASNLPPLPFLSLILLLDSFPAPFIPSAPQIQLHYNLPSTFHPLHQQNHRSIRKTNIS